MVSISLRTRGGGMWVDGGRREEESELRGEGGIEGGEIQMEERVSVCASERERAREKQPERACVREKQRQRQRQKQRQRK